MARKVMDCRDMPSEKNCTLMIAGEEDEVLRAAVMHAVEAHGHYDTPEFREQLRGSLKDEEGGAMKEGRGAGREEHARH
jgi:predicted small metal-binding protein